LAINAGVAYLDILPETRQLGRALEGQVTTSVRRVASKAKVPVTADTKGFGRGLLGGINSPLKSAGAAFAGVFAVQKATDFISSTVAAARESQKIGRATAAVLKSTGGAAGVSAAQVGDYATQLSQVSGIDDEAIQSSENLLLSFTNVKNGVGAGNDIFRQATSTIVDMSAALGKDTRSSAIQLGKALNDPIRGLATLSRVGVQFSDQQKTQIKTLVKSGRTMDAQKIILGELNKKFGGAAKAAATPVDRLKVSLGNLQEELGGALTPVIDRSATLLLSFSGLVDRNRLAFGILAGGIAVVTALVLANAAATKVKVAWDTAWAIGTKLVAAGQWLLNAALSANPIGLVVVAIAALVAGLIIAYKRSATFRAIVQALFGTVTRIVGAVVNWVTHSALLRTQLTLLWTGAKVLVGLLRGGFAVALSVGLGLLGRVRTSLRLAAQGFGTVVTAAGRLATAVRDKVAAVGLYLAALPAKAVKAIGNVGRTLFDAGHNLLTGFLDGIKAVWGDVTKFVRGILPWIKEHKGPIAADRGALFQAGVAIMSGLAEGLRKGALAPLRFVGSIFGRIGRVVGGARGGNRGIGQRMAAAVGWSGAEWTALDALIMSESGWSNTAKNPTSTAFGIGQFLASTQAAYGISGVTDPGRQIAATLQYIRDRYGDPIRAWAFKRAHNWYGQGGWITEPILGRGLRSGQTYGFGERGPELVTPMRGRLGRLRAGAGAAEVTARPVTVVNVYPRQLEPMDARDLARALRRVIGVYG
jgi:hypothetical protein